jgi:hypothetical protein
MAEPDGEAPWGVFGNSKLVGSGEVKDERCGKYLSLLGCLGVEAHSRVHFNKDGSVEDYHGKVYVRAVRHSCNRPECPICYRSWAVRAAKVVESRLFEASKTRGKVEHIIVSVPVKDYGLEYRALRAKVLDVARSRGVLGGAVVCHALRYDEHKHWYAGLHFHILGFISGGYGRCRCCRKQFCSECDGFEGVEHRARINDGYVVKVASAGEERKSIFGTMVYELGHATYLDGVRNFRMVTYFGSCSYRKLKAVVELPKAVCGICGSELRGVMYTGRNACLVDMKREVCKSKGSFDFISDLYENGELVWTYSVRRWSRSGED